MPVLASSVTVPPVELAAAALPARMDTGPPIVLPASAVLPTSTIGLDDADLELPATIDSVPVVAAPVPEATTILPPVKAVASPAVISTTPPEPVVVVPTARLTEPLTSPLATPDAITMSPELPDCVRPVDNTKFPLTPAAILEFCVAIVTEPLALLPDGVPDRIRIPPPVPVPSPPRITTPPPVDDDALVVLPADSWMEPPVRDAAVVRAPIT